MSERMSRAFSILTHTSGATLLACASISHAQSGPSPASAPSGASTETAQLSESNLQDIVVTAQRRDESLSRTPVAVAVVTADTLTKANIVSEQDLRFATPGLTIRSNGSSNQQNYAIRGQSQDAYSGTLPGVLPYVNEVQIGGQGGASALYDLNSVQVLKGPQGTLFGRSATGGAVLFTTEKPSAEFGGHASIAAGNYDAFKLEGAVNLPVAGEKLMVRLAGFHQKRDGFQFNLYNNQRVGKIDRTGGRVSISSKIGALSNDFVFDYFRSRSENTTATISGLLPFTGGGAGNPPFVPAEFLYAGVATPAARSTGIATLAAFTGASPPAAAAFYDAYFADPRHPPTGLTQALTDQLARGPYTVNSSGRNIYNADNYIVTNATALDLSDSTKIRNIFGYTNLKSALSHNSNGVPYGVGEAGPGGVVGGREGIVNKTRQISNEIQIVGSLFSDNLSYVTGVYFQDQRTDSLLNSYFFDILFGGQTQFNDARLNYRTYAAYGQGTYKLNDAGLAITAGLRYTSERDKIKTLPTDSIRIALGEPAPAGFDYDQHKIFNKLSYQFGIQDQVNSNTLLYATTRRAYKSGGFNSQVAPFAGSAAQGGNAFDAEQVSDLEVGAKYQGSVAGVPVRVSTALFYNWIKNGQRTAYTVINGSPSTVTTNVPTAHVYGVELDGQIRPVSWLTLGGTFIYLHSRYSNGQVFVVGTEQLFDRVPDAPQVTGTAFMNVSVPVSGGLAVIGGSSVYYQTKSFTSPRSLNFAGTTLPGYVVVDFRLGLEDENAGWSLNANLKNAFDRVYYVGGLAAGEVYQVNSLVVGSPRTMTVEARFKF